MDFDVFLGHNCIKFLGIRCLLQPQDFEGHSPFSTANLHSNWSLSSSSYLLVAHGSRDSRYQQALEQLAELLAELLRHSLKSKIDPRINAAPATVSPPKHQPIVGTATLEFGKMPLHQQILQFCQESHPLGWNQVQLIPLFLLPGVHLAEDIPAELSRAQTALYDTVKIKLLPHIGTHPNFQQLLATKMASLEVATDTTLSWILLSHGSRRPHANQGVETLAKQLGMTPAYWSVPPDLTCQVKTLVEDGQKAIGIMPYFLFPGGITDAIFQSVETFKQQFTSVEFYLTEPFGASIELAHLILNLLSVSATD